VGGTNPALLQAMGCGALPVARDVCFNREVIGDWGFFWDANAEACARAMNEVLQLPEAALESLRAKAQERIASEYNWEGVTEAHERYFRAIHRRSVQSAALNEREEAQVSAHD
jgi:glycosyltransferase involved in cell wall biosynthesis